MIYKQVGVKSPAFALRSQSLSLCQEGKTICSQKVDELLVSGYGWLPLANNVF